MFPASFAAEVPVFMATPTSACASAGASLVPSPVIATSLPPSCSFLISASLSSGVASARKSSTPASSAIAFAVSGLSPVIMTVRMPIVRSSANRSRDAVLHHVLEVDDPQDLRGAVDLLGHDQRRAAGAGDRVDDLAELGRHVAAVVPDPVAHRVRGALADLRPAVRQVHTAHPGLRRELDERRVGSSPSARSRSP